MTGNYVQSIKTPKFVFGIITPICQYLFDGMLLRKHHRPTLLTSFHHKHLLLLHSLILSSLSLCLRLQMYFDKSFPHPFFILPFVKYPFASVCYLDTMCCQLLSLCRLFLDLCLGPGLSLSFLTLHQIVVKSGTVFLEFLYMN